MAINKSTALSVPDNWASFEQVLIPHGLNGANGDNRGTDVCRIDADNDLAAIKSWLSVKGGNPKTHQAYQKELERLLLWAVIERGKAFSSLNTNDCQAYIHFLRQLRSDDSRWVSLTPTNKAHGRWKPFQYRAANKASESALVLSARSINYANTVITSCMDWLVRQNYLKYNSFSDIMPIKLTVSSNTINQRLFTRQHIQLMLEYAQSLCIKGQPQYAAHLRVVFIVQFAFNTGLRIHELVAATYGDIEIIEEGTEKRYFLQVIGKNTKLRKTSLPITFIDHIRIYRQCLGLLTDINQIPADEPLINSLRNKAEPKLSPAGLHKIVADFFKRWHNHLGSLEQTDPRLMAKVKQASTHWLRHSYGSFLANDCLIPLAYIRDELGHANIATTSLYLNTDEKKRQQAVSAAFADVHIAK